MSSILSGISGTISKFVSPQNIIKQDIVSVVFLVGIVSTFFLTFQKKSLVIIIKTLPRDLKLIWMFLRLNFNFMYHLQINSTLAKLFRITAKTYPNKIAFHFEDEDWSFERVDILSSKVGQFFKNLGYKRGDSIAILMDSRPEFICIVLGLAKIGVTAALINVNVVSKDALAHAIRSGNSNSLLYGSRFREVVENLQSAMPELKMFQFNDQPAEILPEASDICSKLQDITDYSLDVDIDAGNTSEIIFFIYTSGTTGLPKASIIRNTRYILGFLTFKLGLKIGPKDVLYCPVPLYHTLGLLAGVSQALLQGTTVVIKKKFSASNFWKDCEKFQCTVSQYIGEMARYVLAAHRKSKEKPTYTLPKMFGNGMKPETWKKFIKTFKVGQIFEFYGSTEGNFGLFNLDNTVGSVGYIPLLFDMFAPVLLVKCHPSGEPIKNNQGFCQPCAYNEPGLLLCQVSKIFRLTKFDGYTDKKSSEKKLMEGVLRKGDQYFNSGDVLMRDENGYFYFLDRTGDTFRWKGENVSTAEVEDIISTFTNKDVVVYGVEIPGSEGKAGMAALVDPTRSLCLKEFLQNCKSNLPSYSIPIFLRIVDKIPQTGTFKFQKVELQYEGFHVNLRDKSVYFLDPTVNEYVDLNEELYEKIMKCEMRI